MTHSVAILHTRRADDLLKIVSNNIYIMAMLTDIIIATYIPGDVISIGMSHPSTFTVEKTCFVSLPFVFCFLNPKKRHRHLAVKFETTPKIFRNIYEISRARGNTIIMLFSEVIDLFTLIYGRRRKIFRGSSKTARHNFLYFFTRLNL